MENKLRRRVRYFATSLWIIVGIVFVWRGIWVLLDLLDDKFFPGFEWLTALITIILGVIMLYIPHHNLKNLDED